MQNRFQVRLSILEFIFIHIFREGVVFHVVVTVPAAAEEQGMSSSPATPATPPQVDEDVSAQFLEQLSLLSQQLADSRMKSSQLQTQVENLQTQLEEAQGGDSSDTETPPSPPQATSESKEDGASPGLRKQLEKARGRFRNFS